MNLGTAKALAERIDGEGFYVRGIAVAANSTSGHEVHVAAARGRTIKLLREGHWREAERERARKRRS